MTLSIKAPAPPSTPAPHDASVCHTAGQTLAQLNIDGEFHERTAKLLSDLAQFVTDHGGKAKGAVTLKIEFSLDRDGLETIAAVTIKTPNNPASRGFGFLNDKNQLTKRDPRQPELPMVDINAPSPQMVDA